MTLFYSGFNGFGQWPTEQNVLCYFENTSLNKYLDFPDNIENFDWFLEWAVNVFILNSKIVLKGFINNSEGKTEILRNPNGNLFTNVTGNDKYLLFYNFKEKYVWKYFLDPDLDDKWKLLPNFLDSETKLDDGAVLSDANKDETIVKISCGVLINMCLTSKGRIFNIPSQISSESISGQIIDVCCGYEHATLLTDQGCVYTVGGGSRCQLGNGSIDSSEKPQLVEALAGVEIVKIAAGGWHSCAISNIGDLYTWGWNDKGQLGIFSQPAKNIDSSENKTQETNEDSSSFEDFLGTNPFEISLPNVHNKDANKRSQSSAFHENLDETQLKKSKQSNDNFREVNSYAIPNLIDFYDAMDGRILELNIVDVSCGSKHTVIKMDDGSIWGSGCNKYGQLGLNSELIESVNHFTILNVKAKNTVVKCGIWTTSLFSK